MENIVSSKSVANRGLDNIGAFGADSILKSLNLKNEPLDLPGMPYSNKKTPEDFLERLTSNHPSSPKEDPQENFDPNESGYERLSRLYYDILNSLPYPQAQTYMIACVIFLDDPDIFEMVHREYLNLFDEKPKPSGLHIESVISERQKKAFREIHQIAKTPATLISKKTKEEKDIKDKCVDVFWKISGAVADVVCGGESVDEIVMATSERAPVIKKLTKMDQMFTTCFLRFAHLIFMKKFKHYMERGYICGNVDDDTFNEFTDFPLPFENIPFVKDHVNANKLLQVALMFVDDHPEHFLGSDEEAKYWKIIKEYGKTKNTYDMIKKLDVDGGGSGWGEIYATYTGDLKIDSILRSVHLKKVDIQAMALMSSIALSDNPGNEEDVIKLFSQFVYIFALYQYYERQIRNSQKKPNKPVAFEAESESEIEMLKKKLAEEQERNKALEAENAQLEASVNRLKSEYKNTLEKEIIELERNKKDLKAEIKSLKKANQRLKINREEKLNEQPVVHSVPSEGEALIVRGSANEYWHDEERELILAILEDALSTLPENSRRKAMVQDILDHNPFQHTAKKKKEDLKKIFKGYRHINAGQERRLKDMGFAVQYEQRRTHGRLIYMNDPRYTFALASTGSDRRNGVMKVSEIAMQVF